MLQSIGYRKRGFTLIELAIVMAIAGLLFVGLWRLLSSGNQQVRDQSASSQQQQLISAVKGFLASQQGQVFMTAQAASSTFALPLPATNTSNAVCQADPGLIAAGVPTFCNFLPAGFTSTTPNSYGQSSSIRVLRDSALAGTTPSTYSFVILTTGGDAIPDTSGGRISAFIGGDGGFIYGSNVCGAAFTQMACGAYGTWSVNVTAAGPTGYGFAAGVPATGHIATRTYVSPTADNTFPWLARPFMSGDLVNTPVWNTMQTDLFLGGKNFWLGTDKTSPTGGGTINAQSGTINLQGGVITGTDTSNISLTGSGATLNPLINLSGTNSPTVYLLNATNGCTITSVTPFASNPANCTYSVNTDNIQVSGLVYANAFYATTFIYTSSDMRLKSNIQPLADPLADVMKLKPVSFTFKVNNQESLGVIAQDLEKIYPQLVTKGSGMKSVNYEGLIAPLIGSVQQLKQENDELRQQLRTQKQREDELEQKINKYNKAD